MLINFGESQSLSHPSVGPPGTKKIVTASVSLAGELVFWALNLKLGYCANAENANDINIDAKTIKKTLFFIFRI